MRRNFVIEPRVLMVVALCVTLIVALWMLLNVEPPQKAVVRESELPMADNVRTFKEPGPHYMRRASGE